jgi:dihydropteroate synthase
MNKNILSWPTGRLDFTSKPIIMGILNATPDSFSDGGYFFDIDKAVAHGIEMANAGAAIIDIGPESTRPGSQRIASAEQITRAIPIIERLSKQLQIPISIDTRDYEVARAALDAGASIINDITAGSDPQMIPLAAKRNVPIILMHMQNTPDMMQQSPIYNNVVEDVLQFLLARASVCEQAGIKKEMIIIDPGIGFGKTFEHNIELLRNLDKFTAAGYRVLLGTSRKRFIGQITGQSNPADRIFGTAATTAYAAMKNIDIVRVHDILPNLEAVKMINAIKLAKI